MRLTLYSDYCLRVLMYLGIKEDRFATIQEISESYGISRNHLMKVVYGLSKGKYIRTLRGKNGGMYLQRAPESINLGTLVRETEQDFALAECFAPNNRCVITPVCSLQHILHDALQAFLAELDRHTLADLLTQRNAMRELLHGEGAAIRWHDKAHGKTPRPG